jgi:predicted transcriptional regulator
LGTKEMSELNPTSHMRDIPFDDEPETEEERAAVAEASRDLEEGRVIPHDEVMRKNGL